MGRVGIRLVLNRQKTIRGEIVPSGSVLLEGECKQGFRPDDIYKAILLNQVEIYSLEIVEEETSKKATPRKKKPDVAQKSS